MRTEFKREMNRNYMVLHPETEMNETYSLRMLSENQITGLLPFREKRVDGESYLYFNITSKQALSRMMEYRFFTAKEIRADHGRSAHGNGSFRKVFDGWRPACPGSRSDLCGSG